MTTTLVGLPISCTSGAGRVEAPGSTGITTVEPPLAAVAVASGAAAGVSLAGDVAAGVVGWGTSWATAGRAGRG
jgi:hypothetical protein